jgi:hypothetical protein
VDERGAHGDDRSQSEEQGDGPEEGFDGGHDQGGRPYGGQDGPAVGAGPRPDGAVGRRGDAGQPADRAGLEPGGLDAHEEGVEPLGGVPIEGNDGHLAGRGLLGFDADDEAVALPGGGASGQEGRLVEIGGVRGGRQQHQGGGGPPSGGEHGLGGDELDPDAPLGERGEVAAGVAGDADLAVASPGGLDETGVGGDRSSREEPRRSRAVAVEDLGHVVDVAAGVEVGAGAHVDQGDADGAGVASGPTQGTGGEVRHGTHRRTVG